MTFHLEIELGNDAMQSGEDLARALKQVAKYLAFNTCKLTQADGKKIMDANGNSVGQWSVE